MRQEFDPTGYELLFTVKSAVTDADAYAKIQKELGIGLTVLGSVASVAFLHVDTAGDAENDPVIPALASGEYVWDIQATLTEESVVTDVKTVASGTLTLTQDVTRELGPTALIYTPNQSSPDWISSALAGRASKTTPVDADTIPLTDSEDSSSLKKLSWSNLKATAKSYFDTLYAAALGIDDNYVTDAEKVVIGNTSGTNTGDQDLSGFATQSALAAETAAREAADSLKADKSNVLELDNTTPFTPTTDYHPATKAYVDENAGGGGDSGSETKIPMTIVTRSGSTTPHAVNVVGALNANVSGITNNSTVTSIFFGSNVTSIGNSAFDGYSDLVGEVNIPGHITSIGLEAFFEAGVSNPTGVTLCLNEGLVSIGYAAFASSSFSGELRIPSTVSSINSSAFEGAENFTSLVLPDTIILIDYYAFASCYAFTGDLIIPGDGCTIAGDAFADCPGFGDIYVRTPEANIDFYAFYGAASGGTLYVHPDYFANYGGPFGVDAHPVAEWTSFPDPMP